MSDEQEPPPKTWPKMEQEYEEIIKHKSSCGWFIGCKVCHEFSNTNTVGYSAGEIKMRYQFAIYNFKQHCASATHKQCLKRKEHYENTKDGKQKKSIQPLLPWAVRPNSSESEAKRRKVGVPNEMAQKGGAIFEETQQIRERQDNVKISGMNTKNTTLQLQNKDKSLPSFPKSGICQGVMAQTDLENQSFQENMNIYVKYYNQEESNQSQLQYYADKIEGTEYFSFFAMSCKNEDVKWCHKLSERAHHGMKCKLCYSKCISSGKAKQNTVIRNLRIKLSKKAKTIADALDVLSGKISLKDGLPAMKAIKSTDSKYLTHEGVILRRFMLEFSSFYYDKVKIGKPQRGSDKWFEKVLRPFYYKHKDKFLDDIIYQILVHGINRISGQTNSKLPDKLRDFYTAIAQRDPSLARLISANLHGPAWRNIQKNSKKLDQGIGLPIISRTKDDAAQILVEHHERFFDKSDSVAVSLSIDGTKNAEILCANERYRHIVGGAFPDHYIPFPDNDDDGSKKRALLAEMVEEINKKKKKLAAETKLATVSYQWTKNGESPFVQFMARPQTKIKTQNLIMKLPKLC